MKDNGNRQPSTGASRPNTHGPFGPIADASGFLTLSPETIAQHFAQDVSPEQANLIAATQGAIRGAILKKPSKPSAENANGVCISTWQSEIKFEHLLAWH